MARAKTAKQIAASIRTVKRQLTKLEMSRKKAASRGRTTRRTTTRRRTTARRRR